MNKPKQNEFRSRIYTDRPPYADFDSPHKFLAIEAIIGGRLKEHPNAICSYSGGSDSDILIDIIERVRKMFELPPVKYVFVNTGLEMQATKKHVREISEKYGVEIMECRPKTNIVLAAKKYGIPFISKICSSGLNAVQKKNIPLEIADEYAESENKIQKREELKSRYPKSENAINFLCGCNSKGEPRPNIQLAIGANKYLLDFIKENPIPFQVSSECCTYCKKNVAHKVQKDYEMVITGERRDEGGMRSVPRKVEKTSNGNTMCFSETSDNKFRLKPLYYVSDADKKWYKEHYKIKYSDAYEVYGFKRTGCCGCPISSKVTEDLEKLRPYEPNVVKAAYNIFGKSYEYRKKYNEYKKVKMKEKSENPNQIKWDIQGGIT